MMKDTRDHSYVCEAALKLRQHIPKRLKSPEDIQAFMRQSKDLAETTRTQVTETLAAQKCCH